MSPHYILSIIIAEHHQNDADAEHDSRAPRKVLEIR